MGNSGSGCGECASKVTGIPHPIGRKLGTPRIWKWLQIIW